MVNDIMQNYTIDSTTDGTGVKLKEGGEVGVSLHREATLVNVW